MREDNQLYNLLPFFFIIGRARSGTTLLRTLFDAHPNVMIPIESPVIMHMNRKYGKISYWSKERINSFYDDLLKVKDFDKWEIDKKRLKAELLKLKGQTCYKKIIETVYLNSPSIFDKKAIVMLGDKNPIYSISIKNLFRLYPEAKYIHLKRDHRAHIVSMLKAGLYASDIVALAYRWRYSARLISKLKRKHPDAFYTIRYEDLVKDSENHLKAICSFLCLPYEPSVLKFYEKTQLVEKMDTEGKIEHHHQRIFKPIDASRIDSWKEELTSEQIEMADMVVGKWAETEGYQPQHHRYSMAVRKKVYPAVIYQKLFYIYRGLYHKLAFLRMK